MADENGEGRVSLLDLQIDLRDPKWLEKARTRQGVKVPLKDRERLIDVRKD